MNGDSDGVTPGPSITRRLFFALWPDQAIREALVTWRDRVQFPASSQARAMQAENLHITLEFLGGLDQAQMNAACLAADTVVQAGELIPFELVLDHYNHFARARVLFVASHETPPQARQLQSALRRSLEQAGLRVDTRPWAPHVTLYRKVRRLPPLNAPPPLRWPVRAFCLMESVPGTSGVVYRVVRTWPLDSGVECADGEGR